MLLTVSRRMACIPAFIVALILAAPLAYAHKPVGVVVHRGANAEAPENTFAAGEKCVELGVEYVEIDVRRSKDGVHYVLHDSTLDRTTNGTGRIREMHSSEVDKLDAGSWFSEKYADERVPRLREYVEWAKGNIKIYFDVKDADLGELVALVKEFDLEDECFFWFGYAPRAKEFRELAPDLPLKINASTPEEIRAAKDEYDMQIIECSVNDLTDELFAVCDELGLQVMVRTGRNDPEVFRQTTERGADLINLDYPAEFLDVQRELLTVNGVVDSIATRLYDEYTPDELAKLSLDDIFAAITPAEREALATRHLHFNANVPVTVSVMRHTRQATVPFWLEESGFDKTGLTVKNTQGWEYEVWHKTFPAGHVGLGINGFANHRPHYFVSLAPADPADTLQITELHPDKYPLGWMTDGAYTYNDWDSLVLRDVPEDLEEQLLLTTIRGRSRETHLVGGFRQTPYPSSEHPDQVVLSWTGDPKTTQTVQWRGSTVMNEGVVRYRLDGTEGPWNSERTDPTLVEDRFLANDRYCHKFEATLTDLEPGTEYQYQVGFVDIGNWSDAATFRTAPAGDDPFSFVVFGDTQSIEPWAPMIAAAERHTPDAAFQIIAGDLVGTGQYRDHWDRFFHVSQPITKKWPLMPALGNHDVIDGLGPGMWRASHALPTNGPPQLEPERVYSFEYSNLLVVILDSGLSTVAQAHWLEETLANSDADWKIVSYHFPPYNYEHPYPKIESLWGYLFDKYEVDIAFEGHFHYYMRSKPIYQGEPQEEGSRGTVHVITIPTPGREHKLPPADYAAKQFAGIPVYQSVEVNGDTLTCNTIDAEGGIVDSFTLKKTK